MRKPRGQNPEFLAHVGKGRKKGVPTKLTKYKPIAKALFDGLIDEKAELLARLTVQARADIGKHLQFGENGGLIGVKVDPAHTEIVRDPRRAPHAPPRG